MWIDRLLVLIRFIPRAWKSGTIQDLFDWLTSGYDIFTQRKVEADNSVEIFKSSAQRLSALNNLNDKYDNELRRIKFIEDVTIIPNPTVDSPPHLTVVAPSELVDNPAFDNATVKQFLKSRIRAGINVGDVVYTNFSIILNIGGNNYTLSTQTNKSIVTQLLPTI